MMTVTTKVHFTTTRAGRKQLKRSAKPVGAPVGRIPRISKLMALAIRFEGYIAAGEVEDYAELARLGQVTRARITQIMNLLRLAPDIQEALLDQSRVTRGRDIVTERDLRPIAAVIDWGTQRRMWKAIVTRASRDACAPNGDVRDLPGMWPGDPARTVAGAT